MTFPATRTPQWWWHLEFPRHNFFINFETRLAGSITTFQTTWLPQNSVHSVLANFHLLDFWGFIVLPNSNCLGIFYFLRQSSTLSHALSTVCLEWSYFPFKHTFNCFSEMMPKLLVVSINVLSFSNFILLVYLFQ